MKIVVHTTEILVCEWTSAGPEMVKRPAVEVWIGGRCFIHRCSSPEEARKFALGTIFDLGIMCDE
jgi:hypothetical protein